MKHSLIVVGDRFKAFAGNKGVVTVSGLERWLEDSEETVSDSPMQVHIGQGVPLSRLDQLVNTLRNRGIYVSESAISRLRGRANKATSHKHRSQNILISHPRKLDQGIYTLDLLIDERSELLLDHVTGQHIQGMVLTEAARQAFIAVTTSDLLEGVTNPYFVINRMNMSFLRFMFPVEANIEFHLTKQGASRPDRCAYEATIRFFQLGECLAESFVSYMAIEQQSLGPREAAMASETAEFLRLLETEEADTVGA
ncbi:MAG: AfsA-related hotdog domain-containing protein [Aquisalimonadaceae bacterium]